MLEFLRQVIEDCQGGAPVSVLMTGYKSYVPMILYGVDEVGMVASDRGPAGRRPILGRRWLPSGRRSSELSSAPSRAIDSAGGLAG